MSKAIIIGLLLALSILDTGCAERLYITSTAPGSEIGVSNPLNDHDILSEGGGKNMESSYAHLSTNNTVYDVINHPAFEGFGQFILPLEWGYDEDMQLSRVGSLLPYHGHVDPEAAVNTINTMIDEAANGHTIFYDIYTDTQKQANSSREKTGLFFFRGEPGAPFAIVCPGGGFSYVGSIHEGFPLAISLSKKGYNDFMIQYRVGGAQVACEDLAVAISFVFKNAKELQVSTEDYSLWGGSAGARMAAYLGSYGPAVFGGDDLPQPGTVVMAYTGHNDYTKNDPPTFVTVSENDPIANASTMERRVNALRNAGIDVEFRKYRTAGHGFGLGIGTDAEGWLEHAVQFWENHMTAQ